MHHKRAQKKEEDIRRQHEVQSRHEAALEVLRGLTLEAEEAADDNDADNDDGEFSRGRKKHDIFHRFQSLPIRKLCPFRYTVSKLIIHVTFNFDDDDRKNIEKHLQKKEGLDPSDKEYTSTVMDHFYFNIECWRERCRMHTPKALEHAKRLQAVINAMETDPGLTMKIQSSISITSWRLF